jgi:hypothetical protein
MTAVILILAVASALLLYVTYCIFTICGESERARGRK